MNKNTEKVRLNPDEIAEKNTENFINTIDNILDSIFEELDDYQDGEYINEKKLFVEIYNSIRDKNFEKALDAVNALNTSTISAMNFYEDIENLKENIKKLI